MTVRMDSALKSSFDELCAEFGMSANTAMNIFANAVVAYRKIPFEIKARTKKKDMDGKEVSEKLYVGLCEGIFNTEIRGLIPSEISGE